MAKSETLVPDHSGDVKNQCRLPSSTADTRKDSSFHDCILSRIKQHSILCGFHEEIKEPVSTADGGHVEGQCNMGGQVEPDDEDDGPEDLVDSSDDEGEYEYGGSVPPRPVPPRPVPSNWRWGDGHYEPDNGPDEAAARSRQAAALGLCPELEAKVMSMLVAKDHEWQRWLRFLDESAAAHQAEAVPKTKTDLKCPEVERAVEELLNVNVPRTMKIALDSGAGDHVAGPDQVGVQSIRPSRGSKNDAHFIAANGDRIRNQGESQLHNNA